MNPRFVPKFRAGHWYVIDTLFNRPTFPFEYKDDAERFILMISDLDETHLAEVLSFHYHDVLLYMAHRILESIDEPSDSEEKGAQL